MCDYLMGVTAFVRIGFVLVGRCLHCGRHDVRRMRSSRLRCTTLEDDIIRNRSSRLRYATLEDDVINDVIDIIPCRRAIPESTFLVYPF